MTLNNILSGNCVDRLDVLGSIAMISPIFRLEYFQVVVQNNETFCFKLKEKNQPEA